MSSRQAQAQKSKKQTINKKPSPPSSLPPAASDIRLSVLGPHAIVHPQHDAL